MDVVAWLVLRIVYAWMFLYPIKTLLSDWQATKNIVGLVAPVAINFFSIVMLLIMFFGALAILLGFYAQIAGIFLFIYCLIGAIVHYKLAKLISQHQLSDSANEADRSVLAETINLGVLGNVTSAQKNFVLAAVAFFFIFMGSGPLSLTTPLF